MLRVQFKRGVDRFPHGGVTEGATGTVVMYRGREASIRLDHYVPGLEEWDNEIQYYGDTIHELEDDVQVTLHMDTVVQAGLHGLFGAVIMLLPGGMVPFGDTGPGELDVLEDVARESIYTFLRGNVRVPTE